MTREQVMAQHIWPSRLIFKSNIMYRKAYKDLTLDEEYNVRKEILSL